jgi:hypothetical protein
MYDHSPLGSIISLWEYAHSRLLTLVSASAPACYSQIFLVFILVLMQMNWSEPEARVAVAVAKKADSHHDREQPYKERWQRWILVEPVLVLLHHQLLRFVQESTKSFFYAPRFAHFVNQLAYSTVLLIILYTRSSKLALLLPEYR